MPIDAGKVVTAIGDVEGFLDGLRDKISQLSEAEADKKAEKETEVLEEFRKLDSAFDSLEEEIAPRGVSVDFGEFIESVGESLVTAQKSLDDHSRSYLRSIAGQPNVVPTVFRVPRAKADVKFAMERSKGTKFSLLFASKSKQAKELHQQSLEFEIDAVPLPVEAATSTLPVGLVLSRELRDQILQGIRDRDASLRDLFRKRWGRVLVLDCRTDGRYLLFLAMQGDLNKFGVWAVASPDFSPVTLFSYESEFTDPQKEQLKPLHEFVCQLGIDQERLLGKT